VEFVVLILAVALVAVVVVFAALLRWQQRAYTRERHLLVNQLLHATGRTWQPPPRVETAADHAEADGSNGWRTWTATPEQEPVY
jgi:hypothetical protein